MPTHYETVTELNKIQDAVGRISHPSSIERKEKRYHKLSIAKEINAHDLAGRGKVEWNFALVKMIDDARVVQPERKQMTQLIADLKNKTMEGTGKQWCRIN